MPYAVVTVQHVAEGMNSYIRKNKQERKKDGDPGPGEASDSDITTSEGGEGSVCTVQGIGLVVSESGLSVEVEVNEVQANVWSAGNGRRG